MLKTYNEIVILYSYIKYNMSYLNKLVKFIYCEYGQFRKDLDNRYG